MEKKSDRRNEESFEKKPWKTPELTPHPVTKITRSGYGGYGIDGGFYS